MEEKEQGFAAMELTVTEETEGKYLTFWTDKQLYAVPIADVVQIISVQEITEIPDFPSFAKGIIHMRGSVIPIIDVRLRFGKEEAPYNDHTCIIVTSMSGTLVGFIVDGVDEVTSIDKSEVSPPPKVSRDRMNDYLTGVAKHGEHIVLLLDTRRMISDDQFQVLASAQD